MPNNPRWTREEAELGLQAYLELRRRGEAASKSSPLVQELCEKLARRSEHAQASRGPNFRNAEGVARRLRMFARLDSGEPNGVPLIYRQVWDAALGEQTGDSALLELQVAALVRQGPLPRPPPKATAVRSTIRQSQDFVRDPLVVAWVLQEANGRCERCRAVAPFVTADGRPYLEVHHVRQLAHGGLDEVENATALCPNCHRLLHYAAEASDETQRMYSQVGRLHRPAVK